MSGQARPPQAFAINGRAFARGWAASLTGNVDVAVDAVYAAASPSGESLRSSSATVTVTEAA